MFLPCLAEGQAFPSAAKDCQRAYGNGPEPNPPGMRKPGPQGSNLVSQRLSRREDGYGCTR
jgi:hypothetical protein